MDARMNKILICGGNGAGKSTLGSELAKRLGWKFLDTEDYYFPSKDEKYKYDVTRTEAEAISLLLADMKAYDNFIFASVKGAYNQEVTNMYTGAIFVSVPKETRMERIKNRSYQKFGERMLPGGDLYEKEKSFFDMVEKRSEADVEKRLETISVPVIQVDGTLSIEENVQTLFRLFRKE